MGRVLLLCIALVARPALADDLLGEAARAEAANEALVHRALVAALLRDRAALADAMATVATIDEARAGAGLCKSGIRDNLARLAAALEPSPIARREALRAAMRDGLDAEAARHARHALASEDGARAALLLANDAHNRRATLINDAIRPFGVFTGGALLAAVNPILLAGSAVDSLATTATNLWRWNTLTTPQREALARYRTHLQREPRAPDAPEASRTLRRLSARRNRALCREALAAGDTAREQGNLPQAAFWYAEAQATEGCADNAAERSRRLATARAAHLDTEEAARWPARIPRYPADPLENAAYASVARAAASGMPDEMLAASRSFLAAYPESTLAAGTRLVMAAALHRRQEDPAARRVLAEASNDDGTPGRLATAMLDELGRPPLAEVAAAERAHTMEVARYVLLGSTDSRSALYGAVQVGAQGAQALQSLGIVNLVGIVTRTWKAWRNDPASNAEIIERGEAQLARDSTSAHAAELHERLARAYERAGNYERALMHVRALPAPDGAWLVRLEERLAAQLLEHARSSPAERLLLDQIERHFPGTDAAAEAQRRLAILPAPDEVPVDRATLEASPALTGPQTLDLEPALLDGDRQNGELAERGLVVGPDGLRLTLLGEKGQPEREATRPLDLEQRRRFLAALAETLYARRLTRPDAPEHGRFERWLPLYIRGSIGESGVTVTPALKLRRYESEDRALYQ